VVLASVLPDNVGRLEYEIYRVLAQLNSKTVVGRNLGVSIVEFQNLVLILEKDSIELELIVPETVNRRARIFDSEFPTDIPDYSQTHARLVIVNHRNIMRDLSHELHAPVLDLNHKTPLFVLLQMLNKHILRFILSVLASHLTGALAWDKIRRVTQIQTWKIFRGTLFSTPLASY
jgi:hypothetical protein